MVGEHDAAFRILAKVLDVVELADRNTTFPLGVTHRSLNDLYAVEPMLDPIVFHDDLRRVPLTRRMRLGPLDRFVQIIDRTRLRVLRGGTAGIVIDLVLATQRPIAVSPYAILEAAIAPWGNLPIET